MNISLKNHDRYLLYSERKMSEGSFAIERKIIFNGNLVKKETVQVFKTREECADRLRVLHTNKIKNGWKKEIPVPDFVRKHYVDFLPIVSNEEVLAEVAKRKVERYVEFKDVDGIEDGFDLGMQYLAFVLPDDSSILNVIDRNGQVRPCSPDRFSKIELTEDAIVATKVGRK
jgi:hypothetical protein